MIGIETKKAGWISRRRAPFAGVLGLAVALALAAALGMGCRADVSDLGTIEVEQVAAWKSGGRDFLLCDANGPDTRSKQGVIEGALLLTSYRDYDPASELPLDKSRALVFYCYSEFCGAAPEAARKARMAGHRDVRVMPAGIKGWRAGGHPVAQSAAGAGGARGEG